MAVGPLQCQLPAHIQRRPTHKNLLDQLVTDFAAQVTYRKYGTLNFA